MLNNKKILLFLRLMFFFLSLTHELVEKVLFWGQIFEADILMDLPVIRSRKFKTSFLAFFLFVFNQHNLKEIAAETSNFLFYISKVY